MTARKLATKKARPVPKPSAAGDAVSDLAVGSEPGNPKLCLPELALPGLQYSLLSDTEQAWVDHWSAPDLAPRPKDPPGRLLIRNLRRMAHPLDTAHHPFLGRVQATLVDHPSDRVALLVPLLPGTVAVPGLLPCWMGLVETAFHMNDWDWEKIMSWSPWPLSWEIRLGLRDLWQLDRLDTKHGDFWVYQQDAHKHSLLALSPVLHDMAAIVTAAGWLSQDYHAAAVHDLLWVLNRLGGLTSFGDDHLSFGAVTVAHPDDPSATLRCGPPRLLGRALDDVLREPTPLLPLLRPDQIALLRLLRYSYHRSRGSGDPQTMAEDLNFAYRTIPSHPWAMTFGRH